MSPATTGGDVPSSLLYRLHHTPLRDVLRGRLTARLDYRTDLLRAGLPQRLERIVHYVTGRTRLGRMERAEVARELIAHFQDGLDAGATAEQMATSFGDPAQVARLIRRAKRRARPLLWRSLATTVRVVSLVLLLFIVVYGLLAARIYTSSATISRNYWIEWGEPVLAIPHEDRAWPLYREVALDLKAMEGPRVLTEEVSGSDDPEWPTLVAEARTYAPQLDMLRRAAARAHLGWVYAPLEDQAVLEQQPTAAQRAMPNDAAIRASLDENPLLLTGLLPPLATLRTAAKMLRGDARVAVEEGDADRVYANWRAILQIAHHAGETRSVIGDLVAIALIHLATHELGQALATHPDLLSESQLVELAHALSGVRGGDLRPDFAGERAYFADLVQRVYTDNGHGGGHPAADYVTVVASIWKSEGDEAFAAMNVPMIAALPAASLLMPDRRELMTRYNALMQQVEERARTPLWLLEASGVDAEVEALVTSPTERIRYHLLTTMFPSYGRVVLLFEYGTQRRDAALTAIALELHRRRTGDWPATLDDLVPHFLPAVPRDRYDGGPLKYRVRDGRAVLYSVGADRDDDGGRWPDEAALPPGERDVRRWAQEWIAPEHLHDPPAGVHVPDGDWVLWGE